MFNIQTPMEACAQMWSVWANTIKWY